MKEKQLVATLVDGIPPIPDSQSLWMPGIKGGNRRSHWWGLSVFALYGTETYIPYKCVENTLDGILSLVFICRVNSCKQWLCNNIYFASSPWWAIYYKHDFKYFTILQFLQILQASKEESISISITRISTSGGTGCVIAIGRAAICIHYPQCGLYPAPLCSVWNVQSTLRVLPRPRIRRL